VHRSSSPCTRFSGSRSSSTGKSPPFTPAHGATGFARLSAGLFPADHRCILLLLAPLLDPRPARAALHRGLMPYLIGTGLLVPGLLIAVWARVILGRNWSNVVTVKVDHELIQAGPYRWVRHPIYTGLLLAWPVRPSRKTCASTWPFSRWAFLGFWIKLRREEDWMRGQFGPAYDAYCARTARLIPFLF